MIKIIISFFLIIICSFEAVAIEVNFNNRVLKNKNIRSKENYDACKRISEMPDSPERKFLYFNENNECIRICNERIYYPEFTNINKKINLALKQYAGYYNPCSKEENKSNFGEFLLSYKVKSNNNKYITVIFSYFEEIGKVHPNYFEKSITFNVNNGEEINLTDIILQKDFNLINEYILAQLEKKEGSFYYKSLTHKNIYSEKIIIKNFVEQNFYFDQDKLILFFNPYDVGPWVSGTINIELPENLFKLINR